MTCAIRRKSRKPSSKACAKADKLVSIWARSQRCSFSDGSCQGDIVPHHMIGRANKGFRHNLNNILPLCHYHHCLAFDAPHVSPKLFAFSLALRLPRRARWLDENRHKIVKPDYEIACEMMRRIFADRDREIDLTELEATDGRLDKT